MPAFPPPPLPANLKTECIHEPVFGSKACIYEANRGAAQTVILVHGIGGQALFDWRYTIPSLAKKYHVVSFDLPGFGRSSRGKGELSPTRYADFVHFVAQRYAHGPFYLVGHSLGGAIALRYADRFPGEVRRLVLADVAGILHRYAYSKYLVRAKVTGHGGDANGTGAEIESIVAALLQKFDKGFGSVAAYFAGKVSTKATATNAALALIREDFTDAIWRLRVPTLIIWGSDDVVAPIRTARLLLYRLADARLSVIPGAGHRVMRQRPKYFNSLLESFLADATVAGAIGYTAPPRNGAGISESCHHQRDKVYEGVFERLDIRYCERVTIRNARVHTLTVFQSKVEVLNSIIDSQATALRLQGAELEMTGGRIEGAPAIEAIQSRLDLAGVDIVGHPTAWRSVGGSAILFSVCRVRTPSRNGGLHEFLQLKGGASY